MTQMKDELRRARTRYPAPLDAMESFVQRRQRGERLRKVGTAAFALSVGLVSVAVLLVSALGGPDRENVGVGTDPVVRPADRIVFSRWSAGEWHLYSVRPDGSDEQQLTGGSRDFYADISPDGTRLVTDTELPGTDGLLVADIDGSNHVTFPVGDAFDPAWSPDGSQIAFALDSGGTDCCLTIWVMNADGSGLERVGDVRGYAPTWSPDGNRMAFLMSGEGLEAATRVAVMNQDGTVVRAISDPGWWGEPAWSPDGSSILTSLDRGLTDSDLLTIAVNTEDVRVIERFPVLGRADWSPDGTEITYVSKGRIWVIDADGSDAHPITQRAEVENPTWG